MAEEYRDQDLIRDFFNGSEKAFEEIYNRYYEKVFFTCFRLTRNKEEAKDITLATLERLFAKHTDFDNLAQLGAFLYVSARNLSLNYLRSMRGATERERYIAASIYPEAYGVNDELDAELIQRVIKAVEQLPERSRQVIQLRYLEGMRNKEIAEALGISINTVKNQLVYALDKLRASLAGRHNMGVLILMAVLASSDPHLQELTH